MNLGEIKPAPKPAAWSSGRITWRLNAHWFLSLEEACEKLEVWRRRYNEERSHSAIRISPRSSWQNQPVKPDHRTSARRKTPDPSGRASLTVHLVPDSTSKRSHFRGTRQDQPSDGEGFSRYPVGGTSAATAASIFAITLSLSKMVWARGALND